MTRAARTTRPVWRRVVLSLVLYSVIGMVLSLAVAWTIQNTRSWIPELPYARTWIPELPHQDLYKNYNPTMPHDGFRLARGVFGRLVFSDYYYLALVSYVDMNQVSEQQIQESLATMHATVPSWAVVPTPIEEPIRGPGMAWQHYSNTYAHGFPMRCVSHNFGTQYWASPTGKKQDPQAELGYERRAYIGGCFGDYNRRFDLAYHPIPLGLAANTLFYGGLAFGLRVAAGRTIGFVRRRARVKRGRCAKCGYDRAGLDAATPCPECGQS